MLARNDFLDFQFIGTGPREAFWLCRSLGEHPSISIPEDCSGAVGRKLMASGRTHYTHMELANWRGRYDGAGPLTILGAINPDMMLDPTAASRLSTAFPQLKLISFLRDPAELILDLYHWRAQTHRVDGRLLDELERHPEWLDRVRYHRHLLPFLDRFHPDQICLVIYERFFAKEAENFSRLCSYLDVDGEFRPSPIDPEVDRRSSLNGLGRRVLDKLLPNTDDRPQATIDDEARWRILDQLDGEMGRLEQALGIKLDIWRGEAAGMPESWAVQDNVIPLPSGAERRERLAQRRALQEAGR